MVSKSKWIKMDPSTDLSSCAVHAIIRQTPWYRDPSGSKWIQARIQAPMLCWLSFDPSSHALLAIIRQTPWFRDPSGSKWIQARIQAPMLCRLSFGRFHRIGIHVDPSGSKHGSKLPCFAGYHSADSMVSGSKWIQAWIQAL